MRMDETLDQTLHFNEFLKQNVKSRLKNENKIVKWLQIKRLRYKKGSPGTPNQMLL